MRQRRAPVHKKARRTAQKLNAIRSKQPATSTNAPPPSPKTVTYDNIWGLAQYHHEYPILRCPSYSSTDNVWELAQYHHEYPTLRCPSYSSAGVCYLWHARSDSHKGKN